MQKLARYAVFVFTVSLALQSRAGSASPEQRILEVDPAQSTVQFTLDSTLHTVHGSFRLKPGVVQFEPAGGPASGQLAVTAASGNSDNKSRDHKMTHEILEVEKYPEITFTPQQMKGTLAASGSSQIQLIGTINLHGQSHPMTLDVQAAVQGNSLSADTSFTIPYVQWGMKSPSTFLLRASDKVQIHIHAVGQIKVSSPQR